MADLCGHWTTISNETCYVEVDVNISRDKNSYINIFILFFLIAFMALCANTQSTWAAAKQDKKAAASKNTPAKQAAPATPASEAVEDAPAPQPEWPAGPAGDAAKAYAAGDYATARKIWENLAKDGDSQAMNNLGVLYDQGSGVEPDAGRALHWFAEAANAGNASGMNNYGRFLEQGKGVPANPAEAARWFDLAAREGQPEAQYNLGFLYENGRGVPKDEASAAAWYSRAASLGQKDALARLGHFYRIGKGVEKNSQRAALLLYAGAMEGSEAAIGELEAMAKENPKRGSAVLFGQKLDETSRSDMRTALKKAGATVKREDDKHICDIYNSANVVPGSGEMAICYGPVGKLAFLKIDYAAPDRARADAVLKMVESRFGAPTAGEGEDASLWNLGSVIVATRYAPTHRQMSLMYMVPAVYHQTK